jgi:hypothetical protein
MGDGDIDAPRMLAELDFPAGEAERGRILADYGSALDPMRRFLMTVDVARGAHPHQKFAICHLLSRSLSDLLAGGHLAAHCYLPQAYSVLRPVIDSADLIKLFARDADAAERWTTTENAHVEFSPSAVRKLIGAEKRNPLHEHFSESGSHPRFAGAQISGAMRVASDDPEDRTAMFRVGPMWPEHPSTLLTWGFAFTLAIQLAESGQHLIPIATDAHETEVAWLTVFIESVDSTTRGQALVLDLLGEDSESPMRTVHAAGRELAVARLAELS